MRKKTWFVTGASKGLGLSLVRILLKDGYNVAATSRHADELKKVVNTDSQNFLALQVNLTDEQSVAAAINETIKHFKTIDVVVNNAGYGLIGGLEELSDREARGNFDINVFGTLNVIRNVLPHLRSQGSGHIFNIASIGGFTGEFPGFGIYCATKFAIHGLSESLSCEVEEFGIKVTIVSPGYFRTNFLDVSLNIASHPMEEYTSVRKVQSLHQRDYSGNQAGDPDKASAALIHVAESEGELLHLFLGADAYELADQKISAVQEDMDSVREMATTTSY